MKETNICHKCGLVHAQSAHKEMCKRIEAPDKLAKEWRNNKNLTIKHLLNRYSFATINFIRDRLVAGGISKDDVKHETTRKILKMRKCDICHIYISKPKAKNKLPSWWSKEIHMNINGICIGCHNDKERLKMQEMKLTNSAVEALKVFAKDGPMTASQFASKKRRGGSTALAYQGYLSRMASNGLLKQESEDKQAAVYSLSQGGKWIINMINDGWEFREKTKSWYLDKTDTTIKLASWTKLQEDNIIPPPF